MISVSLKAVGMVYSSSDLHTFLLPKQVLTALESLVNAKLAAKQQSIDASSANGSRPSSGNVDGSAAIALLAR